MTSAMGTRRRWPSTGACCVRRLRGTEAGSLDQEDVVKALDRAKIDHGPGGPAEMVPGQHHVRMNMYIAQARNGRFEVVENLGIIDPKECVQGTQ
jgi:branched-chain amino acid transport system substrate-binding protein